MIVHILKMCTSYFVHISQLFFSFLRGVEHDVFPKDPVLIETTPNAFKKV